MATKKTTRTELVFILDRSGSMSGLEDDTIGGFNGMLERRRKQDGETTITTVLFDDKYEILHDRLELSQVGPLTRKQYYTRGCTALVDAIGRTISKLDNALENMVERERPDRVMVAITTDGYENASREFSAERVRRMIEQHEERGWEFIFLGANIDAVQTARDFGIREEQAVDFLADSEGIGMAFESLACAAEDASAVRSGAWRRASAEDFERRS